MAPGANRLTAFRHVMMGAGGVGTAVQVITTVNENEWILSAHGVKGGITPVSGTAIDRGLRSSGTAAVSATVTSVAASNHVVGFTGDGLQ